MFHVQLPQSRNKHVQAVKKHLKPQLSNNNNNNNHNHNNHHHHHHQTAKIRQQQHHLASNNIRVITVDILGWSLYRPGGTPTLSAGKLVLGRRSFRFLSGKAWPIFQGIFVCVSFRVGISRYIYIYIYIYTYLFMFCVCISPRTLGILVVISSAPSVSNIAKDWLTAGFRVEIQLDRTNQATTAFCAS